MISYIILVGQKKKTKISVLLRSKKSILWHFSETPTKRKTDIKKIITSANERDKAHFKRVKDTSITDLLNLAIKAV